MIGDGIRFLVRGCTDPGGRGAVRPGSMRYYVNSFHKNVKSGHFMANNYVL